MKHTPVVVHEIRSLCCALLLALSSWCSEHNAVSPIDGSEAQTATLSDPQKESQVAAGPLHRSGAVFSCCSFFQLLLIGVREKVQRNTQK